MLWDVEPLCHAELMCIVAERDTITAIHTAMGHHVMMQKRSRPDRDMLVRTQIAGRYIRRFSTSIHVHIPSKELLITYTHSDISAGHPPWWYGIATTQWSAECQGLPMYVLAVPDLHFLFNLLCSFSPLSLSTRSHHRVISNSTWLRFPSSPT